MYLVRSKLKGDKWLNESRKTVEIAWREIQGHRVPCLVYSGPSVPREVTSRQLYEAFGLGFGLDCFQELKKQLETNTLPSTPEIVEFHQKYGPFFGRLHPTGRDEIAEPLLQVQMGFYELITGLWKLETLKMSDKDFRKRVKVEDGILTIYSHHGDSEGFDSSTLALTEMREKLKLDIARGVTSALSDSLVKLCPRTWEPKLWPCGLGPFFWNEFRLIMKGQNKAVKYRVCREYFFPKRSDAKTCGPKCRKQKSRRAVS